MYFGSFFPREAVCRVPGRLTASRSGNWRRRCARTPSRRRPTLLRMRRRMRSRNSSSSNNNRTRRSSRWRTRDTSAGTSFWICSFSPPPPEGVCAPQLFLVGSTHAQWTGIYSASTTTEQGVVSCCSSNKSTFLRVLVFEEVGSYQCGFGKRARWKWIFNEKFVDKKEKRNKCFGKLSWLGLNFHFIGAAFPSTIVKHLFCFRSQSCSEGPFCWVGFEWRIEQGLSDEKKKKVHEKNLTMYLLIKLVRWQLFANEVTDLH